MLKNLRARPGSTLGRDFWMYFTGQLISTLGTSFTFFAIPLLIYRITGSAVNLGISMAAEMLPFLFFGLVIGAWVDRMDRKRLMVVTNILLGLVVGLIPVISLAGHLSIAFIYGDVFVASTLGIFFTAADFAAIPSLVGKDDLVTANGRLQASYSLVQILGPVIAGVVVAFVPLATIMFVDSGSYVVAAATLLLVRGSFNAGVRERVTTIRQDIGEGLRYVIGHPVLRNISLMMAIVNFISTTTFAQLVVFARLRLGASYTQIGWLFGVGGLGIVILSLLAGPLRKRYSFSRVALTALAIEGLCTVAFSFTRSIWLALPLLAASGGLGTLFNINTTSLRQSIVPNEMLGRVVSIAQVLAWSAIPLGALLGGVTVQSLGLKNVWVVYLGIGLVTFVVPILFSFTALGHADKYLPTDHESTVPEPELPLPELIPEGPEGFVLAP
jgi:MFS family permease